jgi:hypothetical protein
LAPPIAAMFLSTRRDDGNHGQWSTTATTLDSDMRCTPNPSERDISTRSAPQIRTTQVHFKKGYTYPVSQPRKSLRRTCRNFHDNLLPHIIVGFLIHFSCMVEPNFHLQRVYPSFTTCRKREFCLAVRAPEQCGVHKGPSVRLLKRWKSRERKVRARGHLKI